MLAAALGHGVDPDAVYYDVESEAALARLLGSLSPEVETVAATHEALTAAGSLGSGSRVIGVWRSAALEHPMSAVGDSPSIYLHDVADPGNLGTVRRAAPAFDAGAFSYLSFRPRHRSCAASQVIFTSTSRFPQAEPSGA